MIRTLITLLFMALTHLVIAQCNINMQSFMPPFCWGTCDGIISVNTTGGTAPYTYTINPSIGLQTSPGFFTQLCPSTYTITSVDAASCSTTLVFSLNPPPVLLVSAFNVIPPSCTPGCDGAATLVATGGNPSYTYSVMPSTASISGNTISSICANTQYSIVVTDGNGCTASTTLMALAPTPPVLTTLAGNDSCGISCAGNIYFNTSGGLPPFTVSCTGGVVGTGAISGLCGNTTYTVSVTDANGCVATSTNTIGTSSNALTGVTVSSTSYDASCSMVPDGGIDLNVTPSAGLTYFWSSVGSITQDLFNAVNGSYTVTISNAAGDCMIYSDVIGVQGANCGTISGYVYSDSLNNCVFDAGDYYLANKLISLSTGDITTTDASGYYQFNNVPYGTHTITQMLNPPLYQNSCTPPAAVTLNASNSISMNNDFKDSLDNIVDEYVYLIGTRYIPGLSPTWMGAWIKVEIVNNTQYQIQNKVTLILNDSLDFASASIPPASITPTPNGDSLTWFVTNPPFSNWGNSATNEILVYINTPTTLSIGSMLTSCATLTPQNATDLNMANNSACITKAVATSFDPNDKQVQPEGYGPEGYITLQQNVMDYQIRFQNTGTAAAYNIYILDTISDKLDITTLDINGYSHPYQIEILNGNVLKFKFNNIMLPDSGTNQQASNGYITYRIKHKPTNQLGDVILNTAAIYFDYNSPVITNTTKNTISLPVTVKSETLEGTLEVYPNPANDKVFVITQGKSVDKEVALYTILGSCVLKQEGDLTKGILLDISGLPKGLYLLRNGNSTTKLTIE